MPSMVTFIPLLLLVPAVVGGLAYYLIAIFSARKKRIECARERQAGIMDELPPVSLLKPLRGRETGLSEWLETFFRQDYPRFEIIFAVRGPDDPAVAAVEELRKQYPSIPSEIIFTGEPPYSNAKVHGMEKMANRARYDILVITDSDTSVPHDYLRNVARLFEPPEVGVITHPYRGVAGRDFWSKLEATGMTTEFMTGVIVAERLEGMKFALGPSMAIRRQCLNRIGGFAAMADYLADDFVLGNWAHRAGYRVELSCLVINHHATAGGFQTSFAHRLRWNRSTRFSRPAGYLGQGFTYGLSWALLTAFLYPAVWSLILLGIILAARIAVAWEMSRLLADRHAMSRVGMLPLQDLLSFVSWLGGFSGREIVWRNERYRLLSDGRFEPIIPRRQGS